MSELEALNERLKRATARPETPEVIYEIMAACLDRSRPHPTLADRLTPLMDGMIRMFGGHGAQVAWAEKRYATPLLRRVFMSLDAPQSFRNQWSAQQRKRGREIVLETLRGATA